MVRPDEIQAGSYELENKIIDSKKVKRKREPKPVINKDSNKKGSYYIITVI